MPKMEETTDSWPWIEQDYGQGMGPGHLPRLAVLPSFVSSPSICFLLSHFQFLFLPLSAPFFNPTLSLLGYIPNPLLLSRWAFMPSISSCSLIACAGSHGYP